MAQQVIFLGNVAGDGTGTPIRTAFDYINQNFTELYSQELVVDTFTANALIINNNASIGGNLDVSGNITGNLIGNSLTASNLSGTPALPDGTTATTQISTDSSTLIATTGFVQGIAANIIAGNINLTGDVTSVGNDTTLATVNANIGQFGDATHVSQITVNSKGLVTSVNNVAISSSGGAGQDFSSFMLMGA